MKNNVEIRLTYWKKMGIMPLKNQQQEEYTMKGFAVLKLGNERDSYKEYPVMIREELADILNAICDDDEERNDFINTAIANLIVEIVTENFKDE